MYESFTPLTPPGATPPAPTPAAGPRAVGRATPFVAPRRGTAGRVRGPGEPAPSPSARRDGRPGLRASVPSSPRPSSRPAAPIVAVSAATHTPTTPAVLPGRHRREHRLRSTAARSVVDIVKAVSPAVVTIVADGITITDPQTGQTGAGHGDRLRRHLRRERPDPDQPPRRRRRPADPHRQPQGRPLVPGHRSTASTP